MRRQPLVYPRQVGGTIMCAKIAGLGQGNGDNKVHLAHPVKHCFFTT